MFILGFFFKCANCKFTGESVNLARNATFSVSSILNVYTIGKIADNIFDSRPHSCIKILKKNHDGVDWTWLAVKFYKNFFVRTIRILSSQSSDNLYNLYIKTSFQSDDGENFSQYKLCNEINYRLKPARAASVNCRPSPHFASIVHVSSKDMPLMMICEIEIWNVGNLAKHKPVFSSSVIGHWGNISFAVDDSSSSFWSTEGTTCAHTSNDPNSWWSVDLSETSLILSVSIINRIMAAHRLRDIEILLTNTNDFLTDPDRIICGKIDHEVGTQATIKCPKFSYGRFLTIYKYLSPDLVVNDLKYLTLCEVDVLGIGKKFSRNIKTLIKSDSSYIENDFGNLIDCQENYQYMLFNISNYLKNIVKIEWKGIGLDYLCLKNEIILTALCYDYSIQNSSYQYSFNNSINSIQELNWKRCNLISTKNGYYTEIDMIDTCTFECDCSNDIIHQIKFDIFDVTTNHFKQDILNIMYL